MVVVVVSGVFGFAHATLSSYFLLGGCTTCVWIREHGDLRLGNKENKEQHGRPTILEREDAIIMSPQAT